MTDPTQCFDIDQRFSNESGSYCYICDKQGHFVARFDYEEYTFCKSCLRSMFHTVITDWNKLRRCKNES